MLLGLKRRSVQHRNHVITLFDPKFPASHVPPMHPNRSQRHAKSTLMPPKPSVLPRPMVVHLQVEMCAFPLDSFLDFASSFLCLLAAATF